MLYIFILTLIFILEIIYFTSIVSLFFISTDDISLCKIYVVPMDSLDYFYYFDFRNTVSMFLSFWYGWRCVFIATCYI